MEENNQKASEVQNEANQAEVVVVSANNTLNNNRNILIGAAIVIVLLFVGAIAILLSQNAAEPATAGSINQRFEDFAIGLSDENTENPLSATGLAALFPESVAVEGEIMVTDSIEGNSKILINSIFLNEDNKIKSEGSLNIEAMIEGDNTTIDLLYKLIDEKLYVKLENINSPALGDSELSLLSIFLNDWYLIDLNQASELGNDTLGVDVNSLTDDFSSNDLKQLLDSEDIFTSSTDAGTKVIDNQTINCFNLELNKTAINVEGQISDVKICASEAIYPLYLEAKVSEGTAVSDIMLTLKTPQSSLSIETPVGAVDLNQFGEGLFSL